MVKLFLIQISTTNIQVWSCLVFLPWCLGLPILLAFIASGTCLWHKYLEAFSNQQDGQVDSHIFYLSKFKCITEFIAFCTFIRKIFTGVVTVIANWFGKGKRGVIMGIWNSHTSVGNILGSLIAGFFVNYNWGLSFIIPGVLMCCIGSLVYLFLVPSPKDVGIFTNNLAATPVTDFLATSELITRPVLFGC